MAVTPDTSITLLHVPLELDEKNQITFANATAQYNYFSGLSDKVTEDDLYYQRKDNYIAWPDHIDNLWKYNYVMYQNSNYNQKWFYAFITRMEYENDGMTRIYIETDSYQTWAFELEYKPSFVEREHVNDDTIGKNTVEENLNLGDLICNKKSSFFRTNVDEISTNLNLAIIVGVSEVLDGTSYLMEGGTQSNGIYSGLRYFAFKNDLTDLTYGIPALEDFIKTYAQAGKGDAIYCLFMYPATFVSGALARADHLVAGTNLVDKRYINNSAGGTSNITIDFSLTTLDGYTPKNNKLKCWPFNYMLTSNNNGSNVIYRYEDFYTVTNNVKTIVTPEFEVSSCLTPSGSIRMTPRKYKGTTKNQVEGINCGKFPVCNWLTDVYTNWLTQNGVNIAIDFLTSGLSIGAGAYSGNAGAVTSGLSGIASNLAEIYKASLVPDQARGNVNCGDVITAEGTNDFIFYQMSVKAETAKIIDDFFSMFGYKVNQVKTPNITGRTYWNYVKTIDCNLEGKIPQDDMQKLKDMFNNGVTFWHDTSKFLDYSQSNTIVTP